MLVIFSHLVGLYVLSVAAFYDLRTTEVPDVVSLVGIAASLLIFGMASLSTGSLSPLFWSAGVGVVFAVFGWGMYYLGMWGGADAFAITVLGFAAPYGLTGPGLSHPVNLFLNLMIAGFLYTLGFAFYRAFRSGNILGKTYERILEREKRIAGQVVLAGLIGALGVLSLGLTGVIYFVSITAMIFLYQFLKVVESEEMRRKVALSEIEPGEVIDQDFDVRMGEIRKKNMVGKTLNWLEGLSPFSGVGGVLSGLEQKYGYSEIVGVTEEELEALREKGVDEVEVRSGVRFVPVFPVALLFTDVYGGGLSLLLALFSL